MTIMCKDKIKGERGKTATFMGVVEDATDGSDDAVIAIPDELIESAGWDACGSVNVSIEGGKIVLEQIRQ